MILKEIKGTETRKLCARPIILEREMNSHPKCALVAKISPVPFFRSLQRIKHYQVHRCGLNVVPTKPERLQEYPGVTGDKRPHLLHKRLDMMSQCLLKRVDVIITGDKRNLESQLNKIYLRKSVTGANCHSRRFAG